MNIVTKIKETAVYAIQNLYGINMQTNELLVNETKPEFDGEYTIVTFGFVKQLKKSPEAVGQELGEYLVTNNPLLFTAFNVIKGFLNLSVSEAFFTDFLHNQYANETYGKSENTGKKIMVEYSSPNTNKPLHLGHLRNNFLGWSAAAILEATGNEVVKTCIVNDRGIHICKSMLAWQKHANGATPQSEGKKGDHFVGDYYVKFEGDLKVQAQVVIDEIMNNQMVNFSSEEQKKLTALLTALDKAKTENNTQKQSEIKDEIKEIGRNHTPIMQEAKQMLLKWEQGDKEVVELWRTMNSWVYEGFATTYNAIGTDFSKTYYESDLYLLGKDIVETGLQKGVLFKKEDGSVWIDLTADGLDEKLLLRKDGTSVYMTQDLGLAQLKYKDFKIDQSIYVIADEQNYHMKVLKLILQKLGEPYADGITHLSYGMVELPTGKMKSREGTVVDADDIVAEMIAIAEQKTKEQGKTEGFTLAELKELYNTIGLGALKFFLLRVDPKKRMVFNPEESIEMHGFTGPFVQYTYARIKSILRKEQLLGTPLTGQLLPLEKQILLQLEQFSALLQEAASEFDPSKVAIYAFNLAKTFNSFYSEHSIANAESAEKKELRLQMAQLTSHTIKTAMGLLGIAVPERM